MPTSFRCTFTSLLFFLLLTPITAQNFYFGADLSYINEMEDCGETYQENGVEKDPYQIFADHNCNLVRLRLWHTPSWYDNLNNGQRYADFADVKRSIQRAKQAGMPVLLDFHLSDTWADPGYQLIPAAWLSVVDDLPSLGDSLYNYISSTLLVLAAEDLLPEMVQIGNETNRGILQSAEDNQQWMLDWDRNAALFNRAIEAVREVEVSTNATIKIALHIAGPVDLAWFLGEFTSHGVTDYDIIGMSYYWNWHQPTTIPQVEQIVAQTRQNYPDKEVMIFETAYPWTIQGNDNANNLLSQLYSTYTPASPETQKQYLIDLTKAVMSGGGTGVIYWEPAWVSSACFTPWVQGSSWENATFFDFNNNLLESGGIGWMTHDYTTAVNELLNLKDFKCSLVKPQSLHLEFQNSTANHTFQLKLFNAEGIEILDKQIDAIPYSQTTQQLTIPSLPAGMYVAGLYNGSQLMASRKLVVTGS